MNKFFIKPLCIIASALAITACVGDSTTPIKLDVSSEAIAKRLGDNLIATGYSEKIISVEPTDMDNVYVVKADGLPPFFSDATGQYVIQGQILQIGGSVPIDISTKHFAKTANVELAKVPKDELIIYPATGETKAIVYVFTDVDCPYCTKLHEQMNDINDLGVEVRYLAWPRAESSIPKTNAIWCSDDKVKAMDKVIAGQVIESKTCDDVVSKHIELGNSLGVNGTPTIFTESGQRIGGYLPPGQLAQSAIENK